jgi:flagellar protein FliO/FliZ
MNCPEASIAASRARWLSLAWALAVFATHLACAAAATPFAAPSVQSSVPGPAGGTLRVTVAMMLVLAAVLGAAWLMRRFRGLSGAPNSGLAVLAQVSLGTRERAVLLRVGDRQVLVGVAPGNVRTLHVVDAAASATLNAAPNIPDGPPPRSFKSLLLKSLGK